MKSTLLLPLVLAGFALPSVVIATTQHSGSKGHSSQGHSSSTNASQGQASQPQTQTTTQPTQTTTPSTQTTTQPTQPTTPSPSTQPTTQPTQPTTPTTPSTQGQPSSQPSDSAMPQQAAPSPSDPNAMPSSQDQAGQDLQMQDDKILAIIMQIDTNEIKAGTEAVRKSSNSKVKEFANKLVQDHSANLSRTINLVESTQITPKKSSISHALKMEGQQGFDKLQGLDGEKFDKAFVEAMIRGHEAGMQLIETQLLPSASNEKVKADLKNLLDHVKAHLDEAMSLGKDFGIQDMPMDVQ